MSASLLNSGDHAVQVVHSVFNKHRVKLCGSFVSQPIVTLMSFIVAGVVYEPQSHRNRSCTSNCSDASHPLHSTVSSSFPAQITCSNLHATSRCRGLMNASNTQKAISEKSTFITGDNRYDFILY